MFVPVEANIVLHSIISLKGPCLVEIRFSFTVEIRTTMSKYQLKYPTESEMAADKVTL